MLLVSTVSAVAGAHAFDLVYVMTRGGPGRSTEVMGLQVYRNAFSYAGQMGYASAMAWLLFAALFGFIMIQMRVFRSRRVYDE